MEKVVAFESGINCLNSNESIANDYGNTLYTDSSEKLTVEPMSALNNGVDVSITISNVKSGDEIIIPKDIDMNYSSAGVLNLWEYKNGETETIPLFNYGDNNNFIPNEFIEFNGTSAKLKTEYEVKMQYLKDIGDSYVYSTTINLNNFKKFEVI